MKKSYSASKWIQTCFILLFMICFTDHSYADCITNPITVYAGPDTGGPACNGLSPVALNGTFGGSATACTWTTNGAGTFSAPNSASTFYIPAEVDRFRNDLTVTLTATGGGCTPLSDAALITFYLYVPPVGSGPSQTVCSNVTSVQLAGQALTSGYSWSTKGTGTGTFTPNATTLNAQYNPSASDIINGTVKLTLTASAASDPCGFAQPMTLTFNKITSQPVNRTICTNATTTFSVATTSVTGVTYQWQVDKGTGYSNVTNGTEYSGATTAVLTLKANIATSAFNGYKYQCLLNNCSPSLVSNAATLTIKSNTLVVANPSDQNACAGGIATFIAAAVPGDGVTYQWAVNTGSSFVNLNNDANTSGATSAALNLSNITSAMNGYTYRLSATNGCNAPQVTDAKILTVSNLTFSAQPQAQNICENTDANFSVTVAGDVVSSYQWQVNEGSGFANITDNATYTGATTASLHIDQANAAMNGWLYQCLVKSNCSPTGKLSATATLIVNGATSITSDPVAQSVCEGTAAEFSVVANGISLTYQWQVDQGSGFADLANGSTYSNVKSSTLNIPSPVLAMNGWHYQVVVSSGCSSDLISSSAALTVKQATAITTHPADATAWNNGGLSFVCSATGSNLSYQWQAKGTSDLNYLDLSDGSLYANSTTSTLTLANTTSSMDGMLYRCVVSSDDCAGSLTTNSAELNVESLNICMVTTDETTGKNKIVFEKPSNLQGVESFQVYRYDQLESDYELIGSVAADALSSFIDEEADPAALSYQYQVSVLDVNENEFPVSQTVQRTIRLEVLQDGESMDLSWNTYNDDVANTYTIYRGLTPDAMSEIGTVSGNGTTYTDEDMPVVAFLYYQIALDLAVSCDPTARTSASASVKSNRVETIVIVTSNEESAAMNGLTVYPNPASDAVTLKGLPELSSVVTVFDLSGSLVKSMTTDASELVVPVHELSQGMYLIEIRNSNGIARRSLIVD